MKTLAVIKNELFKDYLKIISTDNLEETLDNPNVPVPFTCVFSVENPNSDKLAEELNHFFLDKKIPKKDFLSVSEKDLNQMSFLFNLIKISSGVNVDANLVTNSPSIQHQSFEQEPISSDVILENQQDLSTISEELIQQTNSEVNLNESTFIEEIEDNSIIFEPEKDMVDNDIIESLGVPIHSTITLVKDESIVAKIIDEKTIEFEDEILPIIDGTKKAFKKAGVTGMALGLANWNYNGQSLKSLKDNK